MEQLTPTFISREQSENIQFYKEWVRTALLEGLRDVDPLLALRARVVLTPDEERFFHTRGLDTEPFKAAETMLDREIEEEIDCAARDLQETIFEKQLFHVGLQIGKEMIAIDGVKVVGTAILPVIAGEVYPGPFEDVVFDR